MNRFAPRGGVLYRRAYAVLVLSFILTARAEAGIKATSQLRDVITFANVSSGGGPHFDSENQSAPDYAYFSGAVGSSVTAPTGSTANSWAIQQSTIEQTSLAIDGSYQGESVLGGTDSFAEAFGGVRFSVSFLVAEPTPFTLEGDIQAAGNGRANVSLQGDTAGLIVYEFLTDGSRHLDQSGVLDPGSYNYAVSASGYGQAIAPSGGEPASGAVSLRLLFSGASGVPAVPAGAVTPAVYPNPARGETTISYGSETPASGHALVFAATGRQVRDLGPAQEGSIAWDTRDDRGQRVPPGVYFACREGARPARIVVAP